MAGVLGVGSGIDIGSIVKAMVDAERAPKLQQLDRLESSTTSRFSALGTLKGSLSGLYSSIQSLNKPELFTARSASSSMSSVLTVKADSSAQVGNYSVQVQQLASNSKVALQSVANAGTAKFSTGTMTISAGSTTLEIDVTDENNTLSGLRDAINEAGKDNGISASIVTDASGSRLVLNSTKQGAGNDLQVSVVDDGAVDAQIALSSQAFSPSSSLSLPSVAAGQVFQAGNLAISSGAANFNVAVAEGMSLEEIRDAVSLAGAGQGISAQIETDAQGSRLVLSSSVGAEINLQATASDAASSNTSLTALNPAQGSSSTAVAPNSVSGAAGVITRAQSAVLFVDGLKVVSESNSVTTAIEGVTLNLSSAQSAEDFAAGKTAEVSIGADKSGARSAIAKFVEAYNGLITTTSTQTAVVSVGEGKAPVAGALVGDATVRGLLAGLRSELAKMTGGDGARALAELGITTQKDGTLKIDESKLSAALDNNFEGVAQYFTGENGLMGRLDRNVNEYLKADGVLDQRTKALQGTLTNIDGQRKSLDMRVTKMQERLVAQYTAMDLLVARLQKTSENLTGQLASLPGFVRKDS